jgi:hypothetical protein
MLMNTSIVVLVTIIKKPFHHFYQSFHHNFIFILHLGGVFLLVHVIVSSGVCTCVHVVVSSGVCTCVHVVVSSGVCTCVHVIVSSGLCLRIP